MHYSKPLKFRTMTERYAQMRPVAASTGLQPWLQYNQRQSDHRAPLRAYVASRGGLVRVRTILDRA